MTLKFKLLTLWENLGRREHMNLGSISISMCSGNCNRNLKALLAFTSLEQDLLFSRLQTTCVVGITTHLTRYCIGCCTVYISLLRAYKRKHRLWSFHGVVLWGILVIGEEHLFVAKFFYLHFPYFWVFSIFGLY